MLKRFLHSISLIVIGWFRPARPLPIRIEPISLVEKQPLILQPLAEHKSDSELPTTKKMPDEWRKLERARRRYDQFLKRPKRTKADRKPQLARSELRLEPEIEQPKPELIEVPDELLIAEQTRSGEFVRIAETELYGEFNFRDTILNQLDRYFVYLKRMKKADHDAYAFYRRMGATLLPLAATGMTDVQFRDAHEKDKKLSEEPMPSLPKDAPWFNKHRPSFGCYAYGTNRYTERHELKDGGDGRRLWVPKFMYFTKYEKPPPEIQPASGGDIYKMTIYWDKPNDPKMDKHGSRQEYAIFVDKTGNDVHILKMLRTSLVEIQRKRKLEYFKIPQREWRISNTYAQWAKDNGESTERFLTRLFIRSIQTYELSKLSMVSVAVRKKNMVAKFGVNARRIAYFFQDRDLVIDQNGITKRIFHVVKAHTRADGSAVKMHFRGLSQFAWAGYDVAIKLPTLAVDELDVGCIDEYWMKKNTKYLTEGEVAEHLLEAEPRLDAIYHKNKLRAH